MTDDIDWIKLSGRRAKGRRPRFFNDPALDLLYSTVLALTAEVSALRERQDTLERLIEKHGVMTRAEIESYEPDHRAGEERGLATRAFIARVMRGFQQEVEAMESSDPPIDDIVAQLSRK